MAAGGVAVTLNNTLFGKDIDYLVDINLNSEQLDLNEYQENALKYFINANNWAIKEGVELYYFSSFDESWKVHHEGDVGQRWGIWNKNNQLKNM